MADNKLTAQQRAQLFAMSTRQNLQMLAKETAGTTPATLSFNLPKARLLGSAMIKVKGTIKVTGAGEAKKQANALGIYKAIRRISLDLNNGFAPFVVSGEELALYNLISMHPEMFGGKSFAEVKEVPENIHAVGDHAFEFALPLQVALNGRDPIGLILLQNDQTNVTLTVDLGTGDEVMTEYATGCTAEMKDVSVMCMLETFSIPANANAYPDLSVLKLVNGRKDSMPTSGQQILKLTTGTIYRKIAIRVTDENGEAVAPEFINSNIELVFNQADINYSVHPEMLRLWNIKEFGYAMPEGVYVLDFSNAGSFPDLGGNRDVIDSANLTEMWLRFNTTGKGKVEIVTECLARLA